MYPVISVYILLHCNTVNIKFIEKYQYIFSVAVNTVEYNHTRY